MVNLKRSSLNGNGKIHLLFIFKQIVFDNVVRHLYDVLWHDLSTSGLEEVWLWRNEIYCFYKDTRPYVFQECFLFKVRGLVKWSRPLEWRHWNSFWRQEALLMSATEIPATLLRRTRGLEFWNRPSHLMSSLMSKSKDWAKSQQFSKPVVFTPHLNLFLPNFHLLMKSTTTHQPEN